LDNFLHMSHSGSELLCNRKSLPLHTLTSLYTEIQGWCTLLPKQDGLLHISTFHTLWTSWSSLLLGSGPLESDRLPLGCSGWRRCHSICHHTILSRVLSLLRNSFLHLEASPINDKENPSSRIWLSILENSLLKFLAQFILPDRRIPLPLWVYPGPTAPHLDYCTSNSNINGHQLQIFTLVTSPAPSGSCVPLDLIYPGLCTTYLNYLGCCWDTNCFLHIYLSLSPLLAGNYFQPHWTCLIASRFLPD